MRRPLLHGLAAAGLMAAVGVTGCKDENPDAAKAAAEALGVQDSQARTEPKDVIVRDTEEVIDADTGKVLSTEVKETPVEIQVNIKKDVKVNTGETRSPTASGDH